jgi:hypothetical protein
MLQHHFASIEGRILSSFKGHTMHFWTIRCRRILDIISQERSGLTNMVYFCVRLALGRNTVFMIHTLFNETKHGFGETFRLEFPTGMV